MGAWPVYAAGKLFGHRGGGRAAGSARPSCAVCTISAFAVQNMQGIRHSLKQGYTLVQPAGCSKRVNAALAQHNALLGVGVLALVAAAGRERTRQKGGGIRRGVRAGGARWACREGARRLRHAGHKPGSMEPGRQQCSPAQAGEAVAAPGEGEGAGGGAAAGGAATGGGAAASRGRAPIAAGAWRWWDVTTAKERGGR